MEERRTVKVSKYLPKHLRHQPERIGLTLDEAASVESDTLIAAAAAHGFRLTRQELDHVVAVNDKRRFGIDGTRIRASQGHSIDVDLGLAPAPPPPYLCPRRVFGDLAHVRARRFPPGYFLIMPLPGDRTHREYIPMIIFSPWLSGRVR
jgi:putative RNA 2'-phosphotransferase